MLTALAAPTRRRYWARFWYQARSEGPHRGAPIAIATTLRFRCKGCKDFSTTSETVFASHKLPLRGYLAAIAIFCNEVKGKSALALSRDLCVSYKCAFVLLHKLRESGETR
jgi:hypothetical protein